MAFKSNFERTISAYLKRFKVAHEYESLKIPYIMNHTYSPDFVLANGVLIECKGRFRDAAEIAKMRAVKAQHPELDIRFCFMYPDKKILNYKTTHAQWAERHGFPWCSAEIPEEWLKPI